MDVFEIKFCAYALTLLLLFLHCYYFSLSAFVLANCTFESITFILLVLVFLLLYVHWEFLSLINECVFYVCVCRETLLRWWVKPSVGWLDAHMTPNMPTWPYLQVRLRHRILLLSALTQWTRQQTVPAYYRTIYRYSSAVMLMSLLLLFNLITCRHMNNIYVCISL